MQQLLANLPALVALLFVLALLAFAGITIGPRFLIRRIAGLVFVLFGVTFVVFILGYFSPGSPVLVQCGEKCTVVEAQKLIVLYHLDEPWYQQYGRFLNDLLHFDLGVSFASRGRTVWSILQNGVPLSAQIGIEALAFQLLVGVPVGIIAAVRRGSRFDTTSMALSLIFYATPAFVFIPIYELTNVLLQQAHIPHLQNAWDFGDPLRFVAPVSILALLGLGFFARLTRTTMLDVLGQDFIRTARAKGLVERVVIVRHALRNALVPLVTAIGPSVAFVVGGAFFVEVLLNVPGIGNIAVTSIGNKDMPVVQGTVMLVAVAVAVMNLVVDMVYGLLDPRIKVQ